MIDACAKEVDGHILREALVKRIVEPANDSDLEYAQLLAQFSDVKSNELANELAFSHDLEIDVKQEVRECPHTVIKAYLKVVQLKQSFVWDQFYIENLLLPAI